MHDFCQGDPGRLLADIIERFPEGIWVTDERDRIVFFNRAMERISGVSSNDALGKKIPDDFPEETIQYFLPFYERAKKTREPVEYEADVVTPAGRKSVQQGWCIPRTHEGRYCGVICTTQDVSRRKSLEKELYESQSLLERTGQMARVGGWELDPATNEVTWTRETYRIHEVAFDEEPPLDKAIEYWHPDDRPALLEAIKKAIDRGEPYDLKLRFITAKGRHLHARTMCRPVVENGKVLKLQGTFQDITEQERLMGELEALFSTSNAMICIADLKTATFLRVNPAFEACLGYTEEELLKTSFMSFIHPDDIAPTLVVLEQELQRGEKVLAFENRYRHRDGSYRRLVWSSSPMPQQGVTYGVALDITELKNAQEALQNAQKIESIGALAGGIAHDFNNLLSGIFGNIDLALETIGEDHPGRKYLSPCLNALERAQGLTGQLLTFSKGGAPQKTPVDVHSLIVQSKNLSLSGSNVSCVIECDRKTAVVEGDANQLSQVFNNIMLNARQAMPKGGRLRVTAKGRAVSRGQIPELPPGDYVETALRDEGVGIPAAALAKIFDPFFSTKSSGSGLGLATSYSIVTRHGGAILVDSKLGQGTTVTVYLPRATETPAQTEPPPAAQGQMSGRVLLMDDEQMVREVAQAMLETLGFEVVCTANAQEAVETFEKHLNSGRPFDIALVDLTVPGGVGGEEVIRRLRELDKNVLGIVASGYSDSLVMSDPERHGFDGKIEKPFRRTALAKVFGETLKKKKAR